MFQQTNQFRIIFYASSLLNLIEIMFFCNDSKNIGNLPNFLCTKSSANGQFLQILGWFVRQSMETVCWWKISTPGNQRKFRHFTQWKLIFLLFTFVFYYMFHMTLLRFCYLSELKKRHNFENLTTTCPQLTLDIYLL